MKICDPCFKAGKTVEAFDTLEFQVSKDRMDVCGECKEKCLKYEAKIPMFTDPDLNVPRETYKRRGRPKKS